MATEEKDVDALVDEVKALVSEKHDAVKAIADEALGKAAAGEEVTEQVKADAAKALTELNELRARADEMEQKLARRGDGAPERRKTAGEAFVEADHVKDFLARPSSGKRISVEVKAIISGLTTDADGSAGDLIVPQRGELLAPVVRRLTVRDLLTPGETNSNAIQYPLETGFTNAAATVAETTGPLKPQSDIKFDIRTASVTTIATWMLATRQILDDVPALRSYIDGRLRYAIRYAEELQLLNGDGLGTNLNGIYTQATAFAAGTSVVTSPQRLDVLLFAALQAELAEFPATGYVLHPRDWAEIIAVKDSAGGYLIGDPKAEGDSRIWGLPVVRTQAMAAGSFLTGAFRLGAQIFDRQDATVEVSTEDSDNFRKNLVTILAEERLALAVYRPEAFVKGTYAAAITDLTS